MDGPVEPRGRVGDRATRDRLTHPLAVQARPEQPSGRAGQTSRTTMPAQPRTQITTNQAATASSSTDRGCRMPNSGDPTGNLFLDCCGSPQASPCTARTACVEAPVFQGSRLSYHYGPAWLLSLAAG